MASGRFGVQGAMLFKKTLISNIILLKTVNQCPECLSLPMWKAAICPNMHIILCASLFTLNAPSIRCASRNAITARTKRWQVAYKYIRVSSVQVALFFKLTEALLPWASASPRRRARPLCSALPVPHPLLDSPTASTDAFSKSRGWFENNIPIHFGTLRFQSKPSPFHF